MDSDLVRFVYLNATEGALLAVHVSDHTGHCRGCGSAAPVWPCDLQLAAARVVELRAPGQDHPMWTLSQGS